MVLNNLEIAKRLRQDGMKFLNESSNLFNNNKINTEQINRAIHDEHSMKIFIGVATEYLLKSLYISQGFHIHKPKLKSEILSLDFNEKNVSELLDISNKDTRGFFFLIDNLKKILPDIDFHKMNSLKEGMHIIRQWRNDSAHLGANNETTEEDKTKASNSLNKIIELSENYNFIINGNVRILLDYKKSNGAIRIFGIQIEDYETNEEIELQGGWNEEAYFGTIYLDLDIRPIIKHVTDSLLRIGYSHAQQFEYYVDQENITVF